MDFAQWDAPPVGGCGDPVPEHWGGRGPLALIGQFPASVGSDHGNTVRGSVTITNQGAAPVLGTTSVQPETWVAQDGRLVALPAGMRAVAVRLELPPGASRTFDTAVHLGRCRPGGEPSGDLRRAAPLPPGAYDIYAALRIDQRGVPAPAEPLLALGGPWRLLIVPLTPRS